MDHNATEFVLVLVLGNRSALFPVLLARIVRCESTSPDTGSIWNVPNLINYDGPDTTLLIVNGCQKEACDCRTW
jgi:hypothetical protein